jgi:hypothetical protein
VRHGVDRRASRAVQRPSNASERRHRRLRDGEAPPPDRRGGFAHGAGDPAGQPPTRTFTTRVDCCCGA